MEHLRQDDAVVGIGRQGPRFREIRDQGRLRVRGIDIDDRGLRNLTLAEAGAVPLITHFEDRTSDRPAMLGQEALDVPAVVVSRSERRCDEAGTADRAVRSGIPTRRERGVAVHDEADRQLVGERIAPAPPWTRRSPASDPRRAA